jgi:oxygen-independent coproporphyrinogen-3 oxidase
MTAYTSYPGSERFVASFDHAHYRSWLRKRSEGGLARPLALYVYLPPGSEGNGSDHFERYATHVARELSLIERHMSDGRKANRVHWGGFWPGMSGHAGLARLMGVVKASVELQPGSDCAIDVDAGAVGAERVQSLGALGINRINFNAPLDAICGRSKAQLSDLVAAARDGGLATVCVRLLMDPEPHHRFEQIETVFEALAAALPERVTLVNAVSGTENLLILSEAVERLQDAGYVHIGMGQFARINDSLAVAQRRGRLTYDLRGHSTGGHCDLLGLGPTAVSQIGRCYARNAASLDDYCTRLDQDTLPVASGRELTGDDLVRRGVIHALICHLEVSMESIGIAYLIDFQRYFRDELTRLELLVDDGLVEIDGEWIAVTPNGHTLVHAVCAVFDRYGSGNGKSV